MSYSFFPFVYISVLPPSYMANARIKILSVLTVLAACGGVGVLSAQTFVPSGVDPYESTRYLTPWPPSSSASSASSTISFQRDPGFNWQWSSSSPFPVPVPDPIQRPPTWASASSSSHPMHDLYPWLSSRRSSSSSSSQPWVETYYLPPPSSSVGRVISDNDFDAIEDNRLDRARPGTDYLICMQQAEQRKEQEAVQLYAWKYQQMLIARERQAQRRVASWYIADNRARREEQRDADREYRDTLRAIENQFDDVGDAIMDRYREEERYCRQFRYYEAEYR